MTEKNGYATNPEKWERLYSVIELTYGHILYNLPKDAKDYLRDTLRRYVELYYKGKLIEAAGIASAIPINLVSYGIQGYKDMVKSMVKSMVEILILGTDTKKSNTQDKSP